VGGPANFTKQAVVVVVAAKSDYYKWVFVINGAEAGWSTPSTTTTRFLLSFVCGSSTRLYLQQLESFLVFGFCLFVCFVCFSTLLPIASLLLQLVSSSTN
jgi:hypothetical protein